MFSPVPAHPHTQSSAVQWKWEQLLFQSPPWCAGRYLRRCWLVPRPPQTVTNTHRIQKTGISVNPKSELTSWIKPNRSSHEHKSHVGHCIILVTSCCTVLWSSHLQCAVFTPLQELHESIHDTSSGNDLIYGRVGLCTEEENSLSLNVTWFKGLQV